MISKGCDKVFLNSGFELELEVDTAWSDASRGRAPMYLRETVERFREHIPALQCTEYLVFKHVDNKLRGNGTALKSLHI